MKKKFSTHWKASRQLRKQRKYTANAPRHVKQKILSAHLSKELRQRHSRRSFQIKKGDAVKVMVGKFKGKTGKISAIDSKKSRVAIEGLQITKKEGSKVNVYFNSSNLLITELNLEDKKRLESIKKENKQGEKK